jgi:hypothetical protein
VDWSRASWTASSWISQDRRLELMRTVLYTFDFEPITVIELKPWAHAHLKEHRRVRLPVIVRPEEWLRGVGKVGEAPEEEITYQMKYVDLEARLFGLINDGDQRVHLILLTRHEEAAMRLKSAWLPGQWEALRDERNEAFAEGFINALDLLGRP